MKRRLALTFAGSAALVLTAGSAAVAANLGILGSASNEPVGQLNAETVSDLSAPVPSIDPIVVTVDEIIEVPVAAEPVAPQVTTGSGGSSGSPAPVTPVPQAPQAPQAPAVAAPSPTVTYQDDDETEHEYEDEHEDEVEHEDD